MSSAIYDINVLRNIILDSQHLLSKSSDNIEDIVSDLCGVQYDPYPAIHLNQYIVLWNRIKDFRAEQLDTAAYKEFNVVETWTFKRNMFFVPRYEYSLYKNATKGIVRWGNSDESWLAAGDAPEVRADHREIRLISPMDTIVRDKAWLETFFDYSLSFEYFKKI